MDYPNKYVVFVKNEDGKGSKFLCETDFISYYTSKPEKYVIYEDTRNAAKMRLFKYLHPERFNYKPFAGTEIGKSIPILNN